VLGITILSTAELTSTISFNDKIFFLYAGFFVGRSLLMSAKKVFSYQRYEAPAKIIYLQIQVVLERIFPISGKGKMFLEEFLAPRTLQQGVYQLIDPRAFWITSEKIPE
jgi:hypothetical protein